MTDIELYQQAKEAYYNGTPIMTDYEFDELEERLGLSNKSYIGSKHNPSYTVKHPFIMGSLSKVQIHKDKTGNIDFNKYFEDVKKYVYNNVNDCKIIVSPKFDGCSFEAVVENGKIVSISSRGDGEYGKDLNKHLFVKVKRNTSSMPENIENYVLRGEVLIEKNIFETKYNEFVNPRSFVSGILNRDYDENDTEFIEAVNDLSIVIYDIRICNENNNYIDTEFTAFHLPDIAQNTITNKIISGEQFANIYNMFDKYRQICKFALDGIVFKPVVEARINNLNETRPKDCVAVKFVPMLEETEITDIEWTIRKTNELRPVIIVKPVTMDGKSITRASAHNYGYVCENKLAIGTKVILSLAGDIIPFIYKITNTDNYTKEGMKIPDVDTYQDGCHLYKVLSKEEQNHMKFISSVIALNIPSIGPAAAEQIYEYMKHECEGDEFFGIKPKDTPNNLLLVLPADVNRALGGKLGVNAKKAYDEYLKNITIKDIITSCTFESCGKKVAEQIEKQILFGNGDFEHLAEKAYKWCFDKSSKEIIQIEKIMNFIGINLDDYRITIEKTEIDQNQIPVILTGEPNTCSTKAEFLKLHPEYRMTTSWKEVQIVFTNSLDSTTGKMKKAKDKGIEIRLY